MNMLRHYFIFYQFCHNIFENFLKTFSQKNFYFDDEQRSKVVGNNKK